MFGAAREAGGDTLLAARREREAVAEEEIDALMLEVMRKLEAASLLTIVTDDGQVIEPEPWVGSSLIEPRAGGAEPEDTSALPIPSDGVAVLGQDVQDNLLVQARELWGLGVKEREAGNLRRALEYFQEAERYVDAFQAYAVQGVYTIRLIPERRDALWRIAEYDFIYGDPFLWPKIWRRNRKLIQNPDLIFPGWQLIIPPK
jgi:nucleoid-associated protein YgaU